MGRILAFKRPSNEDKPIRKRVRKAVGREKVQQDRENRPSQRAREPWFAGMVGSHGLGHLASQSPSGGPQIITISQEQPLVSILSHLLIAPSFLIKCTKREAENFRRIIYKGNTELKHQIYTRYFPYDGGYLQLTRMK